MKDHFFVLLKFVFALLLLPLLIATVLALGAEMGKLDPQLTRAAAAGALIYALMKFFVYDFDAVYKSGQKIVGACFQFLKPVMNFAPYVIPVYTLLGIVAYAIINATGNMAGLSVLFVGAIAFTFAMHIILTAQDLYAKDTMVGKPNYFFVMSVIFIADVFVMSLFISLLGKGFSFVDFFQGLSTMTSQFYLAAFRQFFVR